jgi:hypothetical protein
MYLIGLSITAFGQSNVTNNNTITINGNVYYFRPATTPSSPPPTIKGTDFIGTASWYGEDAAKAWASIADWAIEHCLESTDPVKGSGGMRVYISSVHAYLKNSSEARRYNAKQHYSSPLGDWISHDGITIFYWVVAANAQMEDGKRVTRSFMF